MIWLQRATSDIMQGFSVRVSDPDHLGGPIMAYAIGEENLLEAARDYANTTTDRVERQCIATLLLWQAGRASITEVQHIYFRVPGPNPILQPKPHQTTV